MNLVSARTLELPTLGIFSKKYFSLTVLFWKIFSLSTLSPMFLAARKNDVTTQRFGWSTGLLPACVRIKVVCGVGLVVQAGIVDASTEGVIQHLVSSIHRFHFGLELSLSRFGHA